MKLGTSLAYVALCTGCLGPAKLALLPPIQSGPTRDPDPTRPLVETPSMPAEQGTTRSPPPGTIGPVSVATSAASVLGWLLGGARPLIGIHGTFDENAAFERAPRRPMPAPEQ
ncbi:MAG: hypothetical protein M3680_34100 [Myxococcota bacterium]|nr:hypothetical protein [Myxococcota bacterium]